MPFEKGCAYTTLGVNESPDACGLPTTAAFIALDICHQSGRRPEQTARE
jgi:hypothetical protein